MFAHPRGQNTVNCCARIDVRASGTRDKLALGNFSLKQRLRSVAFSDAPNFYLIIYCVCSVDRVYETPCKGVYDIFVEF